MLSGSCPSCAAPVVFRHAATLSVVCEHCRSAVVRDGVDLQALGKVTSFARDLSPIQLGTSGTYNKSGFQVAGVLRRRRERVRWNEWFLVFDDGREGWLAEGNGIYQIFREAPQQGALPSFRALSVGDRFPYRDTSWIVLERGEAWIDAAEGELPFAAQTGLKRPYADVRQSPGELTGTLDYADEPASFWLGHGIALVDLRLDGLRAFTGWSDPAITGFQGPEVSSTRRMGCPRCGASLSLHAPGDAVRVNCEYCGSTLSVEDGGDVSKLALVKAAETKVWKPNLPLGTRGTLGGLPWEVIGAMTRSVTVEGVRYPWNEHLLHNPYRGFRWLVEDAAGHWSFVEPLVGVPSLTKSRTRASWRKDVYDHFQSGVATVERALGEFTWEVHAGDRSNTDDFIQPPRMLSQERTPDEDVWTLGVYTPAEEVEQGFGVKLSAPGGVAPHQPNVFHSDDMKNLATGSAMALCALGLGVLVLQGLLADSERMLDQRWKATPAAEDVWISEPFELSADERRSLLIELDSELSREDAEVYVSLVNQSDGQSWTPRLSGDSNDGSARVTDATPGTYVARVAAAKPSERPAAEGREVRVAIIRDAPWRIPSMLAVFLPLFFPLIRLIAANAFEKKRWENSDYA